MKQPQIKKTKKHKKSKQLWYTVPSHILFTNTSLLKHCGNESHTFRTQSMKDREKFSLFPVLHNM